MCISSFPCLRSHCHGSTQCSARYTPGAAPGSLFLQDPLRAGQHAPSDPMHLTCCSQATAEYPFSSAEGFQVEIKQGRDLQKGQASPTKLQDILKPHTAHSPDLHLNKAAEDRSPKLVPFTSIIQALKALLWGTPTLLDTLIILCKPPMLMRSKKGSTLSLHCASFFQVDSQHWH